jgi:hypothetical protein
MSAPTGYFIVPDSNEAANQAIGLQLFIRDSENPDTAAADTGVFNDASAGTKIDAGHEYAIDDLFYLQEVGSKDNPHIDFKIRFDNEADVITDLANIQNSQVIEITPSSDISTPQDLNEGTGYRLVITAIGANLLLGNAATVDQVDYTLLFTTPKAITTATIKLPGAVTTATIKDNQAITTATIKPAGAVTTATIKDRQAITTATIKLPPAVSTATIIPLNPVWPGVLSFELSNDCDTITIKDTTDYAGNGETRGDYALSLTLENYQTGELITMTPNSGDQAVVDTWTGTLETDGIYYATLIDDNTNGVRVKEFTLRNCFGNRCEADAAQRVKDELPCDNCERADEYYRIKALNAGVVAAFESRNFDEVYAWQELMTQLCKECSK